VDTLRLDAVCIILDDSSYNVPADAALGPYWETGQSSSYPIIIV